MSETLLQRIDRLIAEAIRAGQYETPAQVLKAAGLSSGFLGEKRARDAPEKPITLTIEKALAIAQSLGVSLDELVGANTEGDQPLVDKYPERARAIVSARNLRYPEAAIQNVLQEDPGADLPRIYWFRRIESEAERVRPASDSGRLKI